MNIKEIHYPEALKKVPQLKENIDDLSRYLRLAAEYGCAEQSRPV